MRQWSRDGLAAEVGVSPRQIKRWIEQGLVSPAFGPGRRAAWYGEQHVAEARALIALRDNNTTFRDLAAFVRETGADVREVVAQRGLRYA